MTSLIMACRFRVPSLVRVERAPPVLQEALALLGCPVDLKELDIALDSINANANNVCLHRQAYTACLDICRKSKM